jgi:RimJ/RimL family protein N-acetyltransferase
MDIRLETQRLILRPPIERDLEAWAALNTDERAMRFIGGCRSRAESWLGLATAAGMWSLRGFGLFSVIEKASNRWVGRIGPWVPEGAPGTEIGWAVLPAVWGQGYATEGARAAMQWAFEHRGWTEVIHCIDPANAPSIGVARRLGSQLLRAGEAHGRKLQIYGQARGGGP